MAAVRGGVDSRGAEAQWWGGRERQVVHASQRLKENGVQDAAPNACSMKPARLSHAMKSCDAKRATPFVRRAALYAAIDEAPFSCACRR